MLGKWDIAMDRLRPRGAYVILGGLDRAGLRLAEELCRNVQARVVLIAGSAFPERGEWEGWIATRRSTDPFTREIRRLLEIEKAGGKAVVLRANLTGEPQLAAVLDRAAARLGRLDGVFHLAGPSSGIGRPALERVLAGRDLDFCLHLSAPAGSPLLARDRSQRERLDDPRRADQVAGAARRLRLKSRVR